MLLDDPSESEVLFVLEILLEAPTFYVQCGGDYVWADSPRLSLKRSPSELSVVAPKLALTVPPPCVPLGML